MLSTEILLFSMIYAVVEYRKESRSSHLGSIVLFVQMHILDSRVTLADNVTFLENAANAFFALSHLTQYR